MLPLGGCLLTGDKPEPGARYSGTPTTRPEKAGGGAKRRCRRSTGGASFRSQGIDRAHRGGARRQSRHRRGDRADRAGRRAGAHRRRAAVARRRASTATRRVRALRSRPRPAARHRFAGGSERNLLSASLTASYEIDFWGKNRAALRAAEESAVASRYDREVVGLDHRRERRQHLFPGAGGAGSPAHRARESWRAPPACSI